MLGAGLLAKKAVERGLTVNPAVKTSLGPGSRVVTDYLDKTGLQPYLDQLGFQTVGYGCTTCIGNSGPLDPAHRGGHRRRTTSSPPACSRGNRNFEARVHQNIKANFLMSPPLVVAFALAGRVDIDLDNEPLGKGQRRRRCLSQRHLAEPRGNPRRHVQRAQAGGLPQALQRLRRAESEVERNPLAPPAMSMSGTPQAPTSRSRRSSPTSAWSPATSPKSRARARSASSATRSPPTTSRPPARSRRPRPPDSYLIENGVALEDFNSYGSRRGNDRIMTRGTFANVRIKNLMVPGIGGRRDASFNPTATDRCRSTTPSMKYQADRHAAHHLRRPGIRHRQFSRDWAAKGTRLLGVKAVVAQSFERIHRSNLCGMGVLPLQFPEGVTAQTLEARRHRDLRRPRPQRRHQADERRHAGHPPRDGTTEKRHASRAASTPPSRSNTTATAASCPSSCGSS